MKKFMLQKEENLNVMKQIDKNKLYTLKINLSLYMLIKLQMQKQY